MNKLEWLPVTPEAIVRCAHEHGSVPELSSALLKELAVSVGCDVAMLGGPRTLFAALHLDGSLERQARASWPAYGDELGPLHRAARESGGIAIDREVLSSKQLAGCRYHQELMQPLGGRSTLVGVSRFGERPIAVVALGRTASQRFEEGSRDCLRRALPAIALALIAHQAANPLEHSNPTASLLTARERDVLDYLKLGLTNAEIALACGTSVNTVRNQVGSILRKLGAANRTEAVAMVQSDH